MYSIDTSNTTRILGCNPIDFNIYATEVIYPDSMIDWRPNAIILVPITTYHFGLLASPIIHFPVNAPLIFTHPNFISSQTINEIIRLSPTGNYVPAKILIVGPISQLVETYLNYIGFSTKRITGVNPISAAGESLEFRYSIPPESMEGQENIIIVSAENHRESVLAAYFSAHMGVPILFTYRNMLPSVTEEKLNKYKNKNVFLIGNEYTISNQVLNKIKNTVTGIVDRIDGNSAYEIAINFSKYHSKKGMFGWNINEKNGWSFSFGTPDNWINNLSACIFAHLGKHSPLLFIEKETLPINTKQYILSLNPMEKHPPKPPFMHGYILGDFYTISQNTQVELEKALNLMVSPNTRGCTRYEP